MRQEEETPNWILIVKRNTLDFDQEYTFKVTGGGDPRGEAQITVKTFKPILLECDISPKEGVAGETKFFVKCSIENNEPRPMSLTLIFYDMFDKDSLDRRLLASTFVNAVDNIVLTRGTVAVFATNIYGQYQDTYLTVLLTSPIVNSKFLEETTKTLENFSKSQGYEQKISYISAMCDILNSNLPVKYEAVETFLEIINKGQVSNLVELELLLSTTKDIVCDKNNCNMPSMTGRSYMFLSQILSTAGKFFENELIRMSRINSEMTTSKVNLLQTTFLQCAGVLLSVRDKRLMNKKFVDIDYSIHKQFMLGNLETMKALYRVNRGLIIKNIPYIEHKSVQTEHIETWMKDDTPTFFTKGTKDGYGGSYVRISHRLANFLYKKSSSIVLSTMEFKQDPYWWSQIEEVSTVVFSITLGYVLSDQKYIAIKSFVSPIDIFLKKKNSGWGTVEGNVTQPNPTDDLDINDLAVAIHRIHPPKGSMISLNFTKLEENDVLRVYVSINKRPDYDQLLEGTLITNQFPWYQPLVWTREDDDILFIGILPGNNVSVGETISYKFEFQSQRCQVWYESLWTISGCKLGTESTEELLHCQCTHLSSIAGFLRVPINSVNPFTDYRLFLTLPENPYVFAFIGTLFLLYIVLLIWSVKNDRKDMMKTSIIFLEDNITSDRFGYLVTVFTGSRLCSGTTSNIGIIIHGSDASSRSHILRSPLRDTLKRNCDDWFLLFTPVHLGIISSIQLWTDHSGLSPNWFCDKIYIHDLTTNTDYSFMLNKWFGVTQVGIRVESFARPVKIEKEHQITEFFLTNIIYGFRESHLWVSIVSRHPRSPILRSQRLSMAMVALMVTLLTSIMFYDVVIPHIEEPSSYSVQVTQILISIYSLAIASVITSIVYLAFKKSYSYHYLKESTAKKQQKRNDDTPKKVDKRLITGPKSKHRMVKYAKQGLIKLKKKYFYPVQIRTDEKQFFIVKKVRATFAWILCISTIVITCFYIILLGLKIGKVKSLLWLTSTVMSLGSDLFVVDPGKIVFIALILGIVQTQVCNLYAYDPSIYQLRKGPHIKIDLNQDQFVHKLRLHHAYRHLSKENLKLIQNQINKIQNWWAFIDSFDICFLVIAAFCVISEAVSGEFTNNSFFKKLLFKNVNSGNYQPTMSITSIPSYSQYIQDTILPAIYVTKWYNKLPLTADNEKFEDTGWTRDAAHRMMGIPRLRQIRTVQKLCNIPSILQNLTMYCNVRFSLSTEDIDDYGAEWKKVFFYQDVVFSGHPWLYTYPEQSSSLSIVTESDKIFHGGGYIAELKRNRRESEDTVFNLLDSGWLDARTRVVFLEISIYGVNENVFTSIIFLTEHLESTLIISGERVWSIIIQNGNVFDIIFIIYAILGIIKLIMILNTVGVTTFVTSFWTMYDLGLVCIVISYFLGHRMYLFMSSLQYEELQKSGKDRLSQFHRLIFDLHLFRILLGLLFIFAMIRTLRLLKYGTRIISQKQKYTLYLSWPKILWMTLALITILFSLQRLVAYTLNTLYPIRISNLAAYKMSFHHLSKRAIPSGNKMFILLPCFTSSVAIVFYVLVLVKSYSISSIVYEREKLA
ncbi:polycystic kidney disease and receptor for egg jelly-related protein-like isoform X1 [Homalodisca vitripennis]|uniref:polycystic kidney disease and receptor for egg jelly-related protein-like isoform X1 n=1 Tax=Homalodisca vitripennis TaxID=197043 RepID=UPI001EEB03FA|nr:polycystic kidney disease and receptor for egg jelly-related protein-like isoform X1 [Homalodisca vitripennis]